MGNEVKHFIYCFTKLKSTQTNPICIFVDQAKLPV